MYNELGRPSRIAINAHQNEAGTAAETGTGGSVDNISKIFCVAMVHYLGHKLNCRSH